MRRRPPASKCTTHHRLIHPFRNGLKDNLDEPSSPSVYLDSSTRASELADTQSVGTFHLGDRARQTLKRPGTGRVSYAVSLRNEYEENCDTTLLRMDCGLPAKERALATRNECYALLNKQTLHLVPPSDIAAGRSHGRPGPSVSQVLNLQDDSMKLNMTKWRQKSNAYVDSIQRKEFVESLDHRRITLMNHLAANDRRRATATAEEERYRSLMQTRLRVFMKVQHSIYTQEQVHIIEWTQDMLVKVYRWKAELKHALSLEADIMRQMGLYEEAEPTHLELLQSTDDEHFLSAELTSYEGDEAFDEVAWGSLYRDVNPSTIHAPMDRPKHFDEHCDDEDPTPYHTTYRIQLVLLDDDVYSSINLRRQPLWNSYTREDVARTEALASLKLNSGGLATVPIFDKQHTVVMKTKVPLFDKQRTLLLGGQEFLSLFRTVPCNDRYSKSTLFRSYSMPPISPWAYFTMIEKEGFL